MMLHQRMRMLGYDWHGGGGSALYEFASCGGVVHTEGHRARLVTEVTGDIEWCESHQHAEETDGLPALRKLASFVQAAPLNGEAAPLPGE